MYVSNIRVWIHRSAMVNMWKSDDSFEDWVLSIFIWVLGIKLWSPILHGNLVYLRNPLACWMNFTELKHCYTTYSLFYKMFEKLKSETVLWGHKEKLKDLGLRNQGGLLTLHDLYTFKSHVSWAWEHAWNPSRWKAETEGSKVLECTAQTSGPEEEVLRKYFIYFELKYGWLDVCRRKSGKITNHRMIVCILYVISPPIYFLLLSMC